MPPHHSTADVRLKSVSLSKSIRNVVPDPNLHLKRDIQSLIEHHNPQVKRLGFDLMRPVKAMFLLWHQYKSGSIPWETFQSQR